MSKSPSSATIVRMKIDLFYGSDAWVRFELPPPASLAHCAAPRGRPVGDVSAAASAALAQPLGYPPLAQAVVPGDRVALAVGSGLPQSQAVIGAVAKTLVETGVAPTDITLLAQSETTLAPLAEP